MTDAEVSGLFADGRGKCGEEHLEPDYARVCDRRRKSEPIKVNDAYLEMAEHYGCTVVPARVRKPRDKAAAEKAVDLCVT